MIDDKITYREFLEILKNEIGDFLSMAEKGRSIRYSARLARKKSIRLRAILKEFRTISIKNDKKITNILSEAKKEVNETNV
jgi:hypothetical protein